MGTSRYAVPVGYFDMKVRFTFPSHELLSADALFHSHVSFPRLTKLHNISSTGVAAKSPGNLFWFNR